MTAEKQLCKRNKLSYKTYAIILFLYNNGISYRVSAVTENKQTITTAEVIDLKAVRLTGRASVDALWDRVCG